MSKSASKQIVLGYMHVQATRLGYRGGYLLLSEFGRPLEFLYTHEVTITSQVRVLLGSSLAHELLVGSIARPMTDRQTIAPQVILVDSTELLSLRRLIPAPVVAIHEGAGDDDIFTEVGFEKDRLAFEKLRRSMSTPFQWNEPFHRIREALKEMQESPMMVG